MSIFYVTFAISNVRGGPGFLAYRYWRRKDIGKPSPSVVDRLKMPVRWREGVRMQVKSGIAATEQWSVAGESIRMIPVQRVATLYRATPCAIFYWWPGRLQQPSLQRLTRLLQSPEKAQRRHKRVVERRGAGATLGSVFWAGKQQHSFYDFESQLACRYCAYFMYRRYHHRQCHNNRIIMTSKCINAVFCDAPPLLLLEYAVPEGFPAIVCTEPLDCKYAVY